MDHLFAGAVSCAGSAAVTVVVAVLCVFWRKKPTLSQAATSAVQDDVTIEEGRKGFIFDDPYHYIDFCDDVKTLSSANSGDTAFDGMEGEDGEEATEEAVYEVIAFEQDGTVNHNPSATAILQATQGWEQNQPTYEDVDGRMGREHNGGQGDEVSAETEKMEEGPQSLPCGSSARNDVAMTSCGGQAFEEEPVYSPVYESLYVDCVSSNLRRRDSHQGRKDSGVVLEMAPSPTDTPTLSPTTAHPPDNSISASSQTSPTTRTVPGETQTSDSQNGSSTSSVKHTNKEGICQQTAGCNAPETPVTSLEKDGAKKSSKSKNSDQKAPSRWGSIKARVSFFRKSKKKSGKNEDASDSQESSTHDNKAFEDDSLSSPVGCPCESAETEGSGTDASPPVSQGAQRAQNCHDQTQTRVDDTGKPPSLPSGAQRAQNISGQATSLSSPTEVSRHTGGRPFSYLTPGNSLAELPKLLLACKDSTDRTQPQDMDGTVTPNKVLSGLSNLPSQPMSPRRAMSLRSVGGPNSGPNTPRSSSKPRPPLPPKPVCAK
ncbi:hypothetical protein ACOMHN_053792 [Nucella lapillus]